MTGPRSGACKGEKNMTRQTPENTRVWWYCRRRMGRFYLVDASTRRGFQVGFSSPGWPDTIAPGGLRYFLRTFWRVYREVSKPTWDAKWQSVIRRSAGHRP